LARLEWNKVIETTHMKWFFFIKVAREFLLDTETDISSAVWGRAGPDLYIFQILIAF
tara:strand:+ start:3510 stop:3680 length:171 start_codon:yes stop_codon:yes gene_type:complete